jgi:hypothetical protein
MKIWLPLLIVCALMMLVNPTVASAQCSNSTLTAGTGTWALSISGSLSPIVFRKKRDDNWFEEDHTDNNHAPAPIPFKIVGLLTATTTPVTGVLNEFQANLKSTFEVGGNTYRWDQTELVYTQVSSDCTMSLTLHNGLLSLVVNFDGVFANGNTVVKLIGSDQGVDANGVLEKQ